MDLELRGKLFVVTGATSGFGKEVALGLLSEGAHVIINARGEEKLKEFKELFRGKIEILQGDITSDATISQLIRNIGDRKLSGILVNAGGPPEMPFVKTELTDWDNAYKNVLRWKIKLTQAIIPIFTDQKYGRFVYIESASVKQPLENLVLSNAMRLAVVGFVKTLSQEIARDGITLNILAPGYHATPAMERIFTEKSMLLGITPEEAREEFEEQSRVGSLGKPENLASLALWLLSEQSAYVTGQTISVDGGLIKGTMG